MNDEGQRRVDDDRSTSEGLPMYFDTKPCAVCGSEVTLRSRETPPAADSTGVVGEPDGVVGTADATVDERVCSNDDCPTNSGDQDAPTP